MTFRLPDRWIWDCWLAEEGDVVHVFFLQAPRALGDPDLRHVHATIGHAVSTDLRTWTEIPMTFGTGPAGAFDDRATWTGSVLRHGERWLLFYTGISSRDAGLVQRIGMAVSDDLVRWERTGVVIEADPRWYERAEGGNEEHWRDPWAFAGPDGAVHLLLTARSHAGPADARGVIGHAWSHDLREWHVGPPRSEPRRYRQIEVPQLLEVDGRWLVLASAGPGDHAAAARQAPGFVAEGGSFLLEGPGPLGPFTPAPGPMLMGDTRWGRYAARAIRRDGRWWLLAWRHLDEDGAFVGELADPVPLEHGEDGRLRIASTDVVREVASREAASGVIA